MEAVIEKRAYLIFSSDLSLGEPVATGFSLPL
jgi:hypothetical protein